MGSFPETYYDPILVAVILFFALISTTPRFIKKREKELGQYHATILTLSLVMFSLQISMNVNQRMTACSNVPTHRAATPVHATSISNKILTTGKIARVTSLLYPITEENAVF